MNKRPRITADYHTHTRYSHGRGTVRDNARAASARGLRAIAITDHGPGSLMFGVSEHALDDIRADAIACSTGDLKVLTGVEANIVGVDGRLDLPLETLSRLDVVLAGLHPGATTSTSKLERAVAMLPWPALTRFRRDRRTVRNTKAVVEALHTNPIDILTHPGLYYPVDVEEVARACARTNTLFEINAGHSWPPVSWLKRAARTGTEFVLSSDAHRPEFVGDVARAQSLANRAGIDPARIVNLEPNDRPVGRCLSCGRIPDHGERMLHDEPCAGGDVGGQERAT